MSGERYEIAIQYTVTADLIQNLIESLTNVMNRHGLKQIPSKALWMGDMHINNHDHVKMLVSLNTQNARVRLLLPDQSIPKRECERTVKNVVLELFKELSARGIKTQHIVRKTGEINLIRIPCG